MDPRGLNSELGARSGTGARREARWFFRTEADGAAQVGGRELRARIPGGRSVEVESRMDPFEIVAAGDPNTGFDRWVDTLNRAGIQAKQIAIADYDRERGHNPVPHPRGNEVYLLVPAEQLEDALTILKGVINAD